MPQQIKQDALLDPKNDYVFKKLFAEAPLLLAALINAVRSDKSPVEVVEVTNPSIEPEEITGKFIVLDVLAKDQQGHLYNIEMQVRRYDAWSACSTYYLARTFSSQIVSGQDYQALKPVIGIHLLDFDLFDQPENTQQAQWCLELRDRTSPQIKLGDELKLHIIELSKADRQSQTTGHLADWITLFEHWQEDSKMQTIDYPPVQQALDRLKGLSADAETRRQALVRERAMFARLLRSTPLRRGEWSKAFSKACSKSVPRTSPIKNKPLSFQHQIEMKSDKVELITHKMVQAPLRKPLTAAASAKP